MKFQLLSDEIEVATKKELERGFISEGKFHFIKNPLPPTEAKKGRFNFFTRKLK